MIVVEKDATFQRLLDDGVLQRLKPCILITVRRQRDILNTLNTARPTIQYSHYGSAYKKSSDIYLNPCGVYARDQGFFYYLRVNYDFRVKAYLTSTHEC